MAVDRNIFFRVPEQTTVHSAALCIRLPTCGHKIIIAGKCSMNGRRNFHGCSLCATPNNATWETFTLLGFELLTPFPLDFPRIFPPLCPGKVNENKQEEVGILGHSL